MVKAKGDTSPRVTEARDVAVDSSSLGPPAHLYTQDSHSGTHLCGAPAHQHHRAYFCSLQRHTEGSRRLPEKEQSLRGGSMGCSTSSAAWGVDSLSLTKMTALDGG